jgi:hypothetical protein
MYNLDVATWQPKLHKRTDHMFFRSPFLPHKEKPFRIAYWETGDTKRTWPEEYKAFKANPLYKPDIADTMTCVGACFFMHLNRFWDLGGCDEAHGHWGQQGVEVSLKAWLSGGRFCVNKKTWFAHYFRTAKEGPAQVPWPMSGKQQEKTRKFSIDFWTSGKWPLAKRPLRWVVDHFAPVPTWNGELTPQATKPKTSDLTILYYTANECKVREYIQSQLQKHAYPIVSVSQEPLDFGENICVGKIGRSLQNIYWQVLQGAKRAKTDYVALCEDDCLYVPEHFNYRPAADRFAYNLNRWLLHTEDAMYSYRKRPVLSQCIAPRQLLIDCLERRFQLKEIPKKYCGEPGLFDHKLGLPKLKYETFETKEPNVVVCHNKDTSGRKYHGHHAEARKRLLPWGTGSRVLKKMGVVSMNKIRGSQHSYITSFVFDMDDLYPDRLKYADPRKPQRMKEWVEVFPAFIKKVAAGAEWTNEQLEAEPYYRLQLGRLNPADREPLTEKGRKHTQAVLRETVRLFWDIKKNGLKAPLDFWRNKDGSLTLHRGARRLDMLKTLGYKKVPARIFKSREHFIQYNPDRSWKEGPVCDTNSLHRMGVKQFTEMLDEATDKYWIHDYLRKYDRHVSHLRDTAHKVLEFGVYRGASLLLWREAFPNAQIFGVDKNTAVWQKLCADAERINISVGRQEDKEFMAEVADFGPFDMIVDDGSHYPEVQLSTFEQFWPTVSAGGIYVIEDLHGNYWDRRAKKGPLMVNGLQERLADLEGRRELNDIRSMACYYNIVFIEKI